MASNRGTRGTGVAPGTHSRAGQFVTKGTGIAGLRAQPAEEVIDGRRSRRQGKKVQPADVAGSGCLGSPGGIAVRGGVESPVSPLHLASGREPGRTGKIVEPHPRTGGTANAEPVTIPAAIAGSQHRQHRKSGRESGKEDGHKKMIDDLQGKVLQCSTMERSHVTPMKPIRVVLFATLLLAIAIPMAADQITFSFIGNNSATNL